MTPFNLALLGARRKSSALSMFLDFSQSAGGEGWYFNAMAVDQAGFIYLGGEIYYAAPPGPFWGETRAAILKFSPQGDYLWSRVVATHNHPANVNQPAFPLESTIHHIDIDDAGNLVAGGIEYGEGNPNWLFKMTPQGDILWQAYYFAGLVTDAFDFVGGLQSKGAEILVTSRFGSVETNALSSLTNTTGEFNWVTRDATDQMADGCSPRKLPNGKIIWFGDPDLLTTAQFVNRVVVLSATGLIEMAYIMPFYIPFISEAACVLPDSSFFVGANSLSDLGYICRFNLDGSLRWQFKFDDAGISPIVSAYDAADDSIIVVANHRTADLSLFFKFSAIDGSIVWQRSVTPKMRKFSDTQFPPALEITTTHYVYKPKESTPKPELVQLPKNGSGVGAYANGYTYLAYSAPLTASNLAVTADAFSGTSLSVERKPSLNVFSSLEALSGVTFIPRQHEINQ